MNWVLKLCCLFEKEAFPCTKLSFRYDQILVQHGEALSRFKGFLTRGDPLQHIHRDSMHNALPIHALPASKMAPSGASLLPTPYQSEKP